jgi:phosphoglycerate dehydrogenase-like enzyme
VTDRAPGEHRDPVVGVRGSHPEAGPIAIAPETTSIYEEAVRQAGGVVAQLDDQTRGLIWLNLDGPALAETLDRYPGVGWVQLPLAGIERVADVVAAHPHVTWTSAKGAFAEPVAEHAVMLTLAVLRGLPEKARSTSWAELKTGLSLFGRRVVIVGAGGVAIEIMRLLAPFEPFITIVRRAADPVPGADRTVATDRLMEVLPDADVVILAAAATQETRHLIGAAQLAAMMPTAALVNIARGHLVDQDALVDALNSGHLVGAGLDVTTPEPLPDGHPLWTAPRCVITSHSADTQEMVEPLLAERVRRNVEALLGDGAFVGRVDPEAGY